MTDPSGPHFVLSGYRNGISPNVQGVYGYNWSSSAYTSATDAYDLRLYDTYSTVYPAYNGGKRYGVPLRCLGRNFAYYAGT